MRKLITIAFLLLSLTVAAQSPRKVEREIAACLQSARDSLMTNLPHTIRLSQRAIDLAKTNNLLKAEQQCYLALAGFYKQYKNHDLVVRNYDRAIALDLPNSTQLQYQKLPYLEHLTDSDQAIKEARKIAELAKKNSNREQQSNALIVLGNIHGKRGDYEKSVEYLQEAERLSKDDLQKQAHVQGYLGDNYNRLNQNSKAETYYRNSMENGNQVQDTSLMVTNFDRLNNMYQQQNRNSDLIALNNTVTKRGGNASIARDSLASRIPEVEDNEFWAGKVQNRANLNLAAAHLDNNSNAEAIDILEDLTGQLPSGDLEQSSEVHKLLSKAYDQSGKYAQALTEYKTYVAIQDSLLKQKDLKIAATLQRNLELQELENQVLFMEKDKELDAKTIALNESNIRRQQTIIAAAFSMALLILVSLIVVIRKSRSKTVANNLLELKSLRTRMNPHFIFNSLNSVNHFIAQNDEKAANKYLSQFSKLMRDVLDSSDKDFIPLEKEVDLLKVYLALEHQRFASKFEYSLDIDQEIQGGEHMVPPMLVQPFIENAIWHGLRYIDYPGRLAVRFFQKGQNLVIEIEDNGIGRQASLAMKTRSQIQHKSSGISNSKNRVDIINKVYGESISIDIADKGGAETGTLVQIRIRNKHGN